MKPIHTCVFTFILYYFFLQSSYSQGLYKYEGLLKDSSQFIYVFTGDTVDVQKYIYDAEDKLLEFQFNENYIQYFEYPAANKVEITGVSLGVPISFEVALLDSNGNEISRDKKRYKASTGELISHEIDSTVYDQNGKKIKVLEYSVIDGQKILDYYNFKTWSGDNLLEREVYRFEMGIPVYENITSYTYNQNNQRIFTNSKQKTNGNDLEVNTSFHYNQNELMDSIHTITLENNIWKSENYSIYSYEGLKKINEKYSALNETDPFIIDRKYEIWENTSGGLIIDDSIKLYLPVNNELLLDQVNYYRDENIDDDHIKIESEQIKIENNIITNHQIYLNYWHKSSSWVPINEEELSDVKIGPNPILGGEEISITLANKSGSAVLIYDMSGNLVGRELVLGKQFYIQMPEVAGSYLLQVMDKNNKALTKAKIIQVF